MANDKSIQDDFTALMKGDCTRIPNIETKMDELELKISKDCKNLAIKYILDKNSPSGQNICTLSTGTNNPMMQMRQGLSTIKGMCANNTLPKVQ